MQVSCSLSVIAPGKPIEVKMLRFLRSVAKEGNKLVMNVSRARVQTASKTIYLSG